MRHETLAAAAALYERLPAPAQELAHKSLAGLLRGMGLRTSLEWLAEKEKAQGQQVAAALLGALGLSSPAELERRSAVEQLELARQAHALCEALHIVARASKNGAL